LLGLAWTGDDLPVAVRYDLEKPATRMALIADLVEGCDVGPALARRYGVTNQAIYLFKRRHADEIDAALAIVRQALAETWTAVKAERVAALQSDIELIDQWLGRAGLDRDELAALERAGSDPDDANATLERAGLDVQAVATLVRERRAHLRAIAEELGDIPRGRPAEDDGVQVRYVIEGVDLDAV